MNYFLFLILRIFVVCKSILEVILTLRDVNLFELLIRFLQGENGVVKIGEDFIGLELKYRSVMTLWIVQIWKKFIGLQYYPMPSNFNYLSILFILNFIALFEQSRTH